MSGKRKAASPPPDAPILHDWRGHVGWPSSLPRYRGLLAAGREPPFTVFYGPRGIGKQSLLAAAAALYFCETGTACAACEGCLSIMKGRQAEALWLGLEDGAIKVEDAAMLQEHAGLLPSPLNWTDAARAHHADQGLRRLVIIPDLDRLTEPAANRLLKTLEEPPAHVRILASTSRMGSMLPTILSRAVKWRVPVPDKAATTAWLAAHLGAQGQAVAPAALAEAVDAYGRAPGRALRYFTEQGQAEAQVEERLREALGQRDRDGLLRTVEILARDHGLGMEELLERAEKVLNRCLKEQLSLVAPRGDRAPSKLQRFTYRHEWRTILRDIRQLHRHGRRVALNAQLTLEALVL